MPYLKTTLKQAWTVLLFDATLPTLLTRMFRRLYSITLGILAILFMASVPVADVLAQNCRADEQEVSIGSDIPNSRPSGSPAGTYCVPLNSTSTNITDNPIVAFLRMVLQFFAVGIGMALVGGLVAGGLVYMTARANASQVQKGEDILRNAIIGIALYVFMFAIINFLIPGGLLN